LPAWKSHAIFHLERHRQRGQRRDGALDPLAVDVSHDNCLTRFDDVLKLVEGARGILRPQGRGRQNQCQS
jgi:hypothetical protein